MRHKKPQLRRCTRCNSAGHNRATCQVGELKKSPVFASPLKFFVHHVPVAPSNSPHVVNLKNADTSIWHTIDTAAPVTDPASTFHTYHELPKPAPEKPTSLPPIKEKNTAIISPPAQPAKPTVAIDKTWKDFFSTLFPLKPVATVLVLVALALTVPSRARSYFENLQQTKAIIADNSTAGFLALQQSTVALKNADIDTAASATILAEDKFNTALSTIETKHRILQTIISVVPVVHGELASREKILLAGQEITLGNADILATLQNAKNSPTKSLTDKLADLSTALAGALPNYNAAVTNLAAVDVGTLPYQYQAQFIDFRNLFTALVADFKSVSDLSSTLQETFGGHGFRRYLLVFQNPAELRPTGGFIGSFAVLDINNGAIQKLDIPAGGSYDLQGQLPEYLIPPLPLTLANKRWEFQDANWFPDFPASAKKIAWFYNRSRGVTVDGVIALNATVLERLLSIVGPVVDTKRNLTLTAETALPTIQMVVESSTEKTAHRPKAILADLAPQLFHSLTSTPSTALLPLLITLEDALGQKEIQAYFTDHDAEKNIISYGWSGAISPTQPNEDYLFVVNTNIQGEKSDAKIKQTISHQAVVDADGGIVDTVIITREHTGTASEPLYGTANLDYLRLYVPEGSILLSASGFTWPEEKNFRAPEKWYTTDADLGQKETAIGIDDASGTHITNEFGKTVFGNWVATAPGSQSQIVFSYRLPFKLAMNQKYSTNIVDKILAPFSKSLREYSLLVQKQSGITSDFESQLLLPAGWTPKWQSTDAILTADNGVRINRLTLTNDRLWSTLIQPTNQ